MTWTFLIFKNDTKTCIIANLYPIKYYRGKKLKTCQERPQLVSFQFIKAFYKTTTSPKWPLLSGPKSGRLIQIWMYILKVERQSSISPHYILWNWHISDPCSAVLNFTFNIFTGCMEPCLKPFNKEIGNLFFS